MTEPTPAFLLACRGEPVARTPIWMMRQAGRSLPAYRALRERYGFLDIIEHAELMTEVTLLPLAEMDLDAAVMFADIMLPLRAAEVRFEIVESIGPVIADPIRSARDVAGLGDVPMHEAVPTVFEAIRLARKELGGRIPLIGFSGAPFTLASYLIEGRPSKDFATTKRLMAEQPETWHALMERLTALTIEYLREQVAAGVQALQLFDSWLGALSPEDARTSVFPYTRRIFDALAGFDVPRIHFATGVAGMLEDIAATGPDLVGVDWRIDLDAAWARIGALGIQGNLEPAVLHAPHDVIAERACDIMRRASGRPGHIFNLGHGVPPDAPLPALKFLVDTVHEGITP